MNHYDSSVGFITSRTRRLAESTAAAYTAELRCLHFAIAVSDPVRFQSALQIPSNTSDSAAHPQIGRSTFSLISTPLKTRFQSASRMLNEKDSIMNAALTESKTCFINPKRLPHSDCADYSSRDIDVRNRNSPFLKSTAKPMSLLYYAESRKALLPESGSVCNSVKEGPNNASITLTSCVKGGTKRNNKQLSTVVRSDKRNPKLKADDESLFKKDDSKDFDAQHNRSQKMIRATSHGNVMPTKIVVESKSVQLGMIFSHAPLITRMTSDNNEKAKTVSARLMMEIGSGSNIAVALDSTTPPKFQLHQPDDESLSLGTLVNDSSEDDFLFS